MYDAQWHGTKVAVKAITPHVVQQNEFILECELLASLRHPNIVQLLAVVSGPDGADASSLAAPVRDRQPSPAQRLTRRACRP